MRCFMKPIFLCWLHEQSRAVCAEHSPGDLQLPGSGGARQGSGCSSAQREMGLAQREAQQSFSIGCHRQKWSHQSSAAAPGVEEWEGGQNPTSTLLLEGWDDVQAPFSAR